MNITGTFIDLLSGDIPAMNWGEKQWDREFAMMKSVGINTLILLRSSYKEWLCYRSEYMHKIAGCINPPVDSLKMLLQLAEKHGLNLYVGTYNSYHDWLTAAYNVDYEAELIMRSVDEIWRNYGDSPAFKGWYMTHEISRKLSFRIVELFQKVAPHCKKISGGLPVLMSPGIDGIKDGNKKDRRLAVTLQEHREDWDWIMGELSGMIDIIAFQDGHVDFKELESFLEVNSVLAAKHKIECWTNAETFDRDISSDTSFTPIRWDKLIFKLDAAKRTGHSKAITFDFTHFLSPYSCYPQAKYLLERYCEYYGINLKKEELE